MPAPEGCCPDCWCEIGDDSQSMPNASRFCDECLRARILAGEQVDIGVWENPITDKSEHLFYSGCTRCKGTGQYLVSAWQQHTYCFNCVGLGAVLLDREGVQRTGRWWTTFQENREPGKKKRPGPPEHTHPRRR